MREDWSSYPSFLSSGKGYRAPLVHHFRSRNPQLRKRECAAMMLPHSYNFPQATLLCTYQPTPPNGGGITMNKYLKITAHVLGNSVGTTKELVKKLDAAASERANRIDDEKVAYYEAEIKRLKAKK